MTNTGYIELREGLSPDRIWFTSDTHFFHEKVIGYSRRPFANAEEMNDVMIERWNSVVRNSDIVFHLGDFCFGTGDKWSHILDRLKGRIYLILGNHDLRHLGEETMARFESVAIQMRLKVNGQKILLNHYPSLSFGGDNHGTWQLFGHVHSNHGKSNIADKRRLSVLLPEQYDVGVDNNDFKPVSFRQVERIISDQINMRYISDCDN